MQKWTTLTFLVQICPKINLGLQIQKTNVGIRINILQIPCVCQFSGKTDNIDFFGPKNEVWVRNFKTLSPDLDSAPLSILASQFSVKIGNFQFLGLNLGKLPNTCNIKVQIPLKVLQRAGWRLEWAGWRLKWAGCTVSNTQF